MRFDHSRINEKAPYCAICGKPEVPCYHFSVIGEADTSPKKTTTNVRILIDDQPFGGFLCDTMGEAETLANRLMVSNERIPMDVKAACKTLERLGYTWEGGQEWKPPILKQWDGKGVPPVGAHVQYQHNGFITWEFATVMAVGKNSIILSPDPESEVEFYYKIKSLVLRPGDTEIRQLITDHHTAISQSTKIMGDPAENTAVILHQMGYRKVEPK